MMSAYSYSIEFRPTEVHANADGLSRLPLHSRMQTPQVQLADSVFNVAQMQCLPVSASDLELTIEGGCVLWGIRVVVPEKLRKAVIRTVHEGHVGIVRMK